ncbi:histidine kinase [Streptomyces albiflavescens]|uniref:histidine kinase n=1 Tax=Streptomyces albiflavescens TaxID=1623582 RepID=A0A918DAH6_9ACTN|nr:nitrate- and nitrite sensing domain-containing protein [Streptomyces albiflavescens]GGN96593.1 histidine kinase [Streptomyces albiflavescens]
MVCLTGLGGYTAASLVNEHVQLQADADHVSSVARPVQEVLARLQDERRLTAVWQANRTGSAREDLDAARKKTDATVSDFRRRISAPDTAALNRRVQALDGALESLTDRRDAVDARTLSASGSFAYFTAGVSQCLALLTEAVRSADGELGRGGTATVALAQSTEMLAREDALLSGSLSVRRISVTDRARFGQYLAGQQASRAYLITRDLPGTAATQYGHITSSAQWTTLGAVERAVTGGQGTSLPKQATSWTTAAGSVVGSSRTLAASSLDSLADRADDRADELLLAALMGSAVTLAVVAGAAVLAGRARRSTLGRLAELQEETQQWAMRRLPETLARIERGERVDPIALVPFRPQATDQIGQLATDIDQLVRVAAHSTMRQSQGRQGTEKVVGQLIRRAQTLIHRLIKLLDDLERKHEDSDLLKDIFQVDHLATRVRRHTENLLILSGAPPGRRTTPPTSITDVMRGAVAETEQYTRVRVKNTPADRRMALASRAVGDVTHLLAELIENGTSFSPPHTQVTVSATRVAKGLAVHVEDQGLGIKPEQLGHANELLANPPRIDITALGEDPRLGHFVVAQLAERHGIRVVLRESDYGGTLALVVLPAALLEVVPSPVLDQLQSAAVTTGRAVVEDPSLTSASERAYTRQDVLPSVSAGALDEVVTHSPVPDHSGFPDYGGAGLLPPASGHHELPASESAGWTPRESDPPLSRSGPRAGSTEHPAESSREPAEVPGPELPRRQRPPARPEPSRATAAPDTKPLHTLDVPEVLPQRVKGANLARELRREAAALQDPAVGESHNAFLSPEAAARAMSAIDAGLRRAGTDDERHGPYARQDESADPSASER